jgi:hypothetical protein
LPIVLKNYGLQWPLSAPKSERLTTKIVLKLNTGIKLTPTIPGVTFAPAPSTANYEQMLSAGSPPAGRDHEIATSAATCHPALRDAPPRRKIGDCKK